MTIREIDVHIAGPERHRWCRLPSSFAADRVRREHTDMIRQLWAALHGGELVMETRRAA